MASFDPNIQQQNAPQSVSTQSKSIEEPKINRSKEFLFSGIGDTVAEGLNSADKLQETNVKQQVTTAQEKEADYQRSWEKNQAGIADPEDLLRLSQPPQQIQNYQDRSDLLKQAAESGKIPDAYFKMRQLALAKQFRDQYPGYRNAIDETTARVTGQNPANALREDLQSAAQEARSKRDQQKNKLENELWQNLGVPGVEGVLAAVRSGKAVDEGAVISVIAHAKQMKADLEVQQAKATYLNSISSLSDKEKKDATDSSEKAWDNAVSKAIINQVNGYSAIGEGPDRLGTKENMERIRQRGLNPSSATDVEARNFTAALATSKATFEQQMLVLASNKGPPTQKYPEGSPSKVQEIGLDKVMASIKKASSGFYDPMLDAASHQEYGVMNAAVQISKAMQQDTGLKIDQEPGLGPPLRIVNKFKQAGGDVFAGNLLVPWAQDGQLGNMLQATIRFYQMQTMTGDVPTGSIGKTPIEVLENLQKLGADTKSFNMIVNDTPAMFTDSTAKPQAKVNLANHFYIPENSKFISKFALDTRDVNNGKFVPGFETVFQRMASPAVTRQAHELGKTEPAVWDNYVRWARNVFSEGLIANEKLHKFSEATLSPGSHVRWSSESNSFRIQTDKPTGPIGRGVIRGERRSIYQEVIDSVNKQIQPLVPIAKEQNQDVRVLIAEAMLKHRDNAVFQTILDSVKASVVKPKPVVAK